MQLVLYTSPNHKKILILKTNGYYTKGIRAAYPHYAREPNNKIFSIVTRFI